MNRIRPGFYLDRQRWDATPSWDRMGLIIVARAAAYPDTVFTGAAALFVHGMPLLDLPQWIEIQGRPSSHPRVYPALSDRSEHALGRQRWAFLSQPGSLDHVHVNGVRAIPLDTAVGLYLREADLRSAVVVLDAYRHRLLKADRPMDRIPDSWLDTGVAAERDRVLQAWEYSEPLSESPAETQTRVNAVLLGFERPVAQVWVQAPNGKHYRLDLVWPEAKCVVEVDGRGKLGETPEERAAALEDERVRQEALQQMGFHVVRVTAEQARDAAALKDILAGNGIPLTR